MEIILEKDKLIKENENKLEDVIKENKLKLEKTIKEYENKILEMDKIIKIKKY